MKTKTYPYLSTAFVSGFAVMVFELVSSRLLSPFFGSSMLVWTSVIGIILASLSVGYWWGGRIADSKDAEKALTFVTGAAGLWIVLISSWHTGALLLIESGELGLSFAATCGALIICAVPALLLGCVSPLCGKLSLIELGSAGVTIGNLGAVSTLGSIFGTFLTGFLFLPSFGSRTLLYMLGLLLLANSLFLASRAVRRGLLGVSLIVFAALPLFEAGGRESEDWFSSRVLADIDTSYSRVWVVEHRDVSSSRMVRSLLFDPFGIQGSIYLPLASGTNFALPAENLVYHYARNFRVVKHFVPTTRRLLVIGGGIFTVPTDLSRLYPNAQVDVVEIDGKLTKLAQDYFNFLPSPSISIYPEDGRSFLNRSRDKYDAVFLDAFGSGHNIPFQLATLECAKRIFDLLSDNGVALLNVYGTLLGDAGELLRAEINTYSQVFPQILLFPTITNQDPSVLQNFVVVALKTASEPVLRSDEEYLQKILEKRWTGQFRGSQIILTDDYAPVETFSHAILSQSKGIRHFEQTSESTTDIDSMGGI